MGKAFAAAMGLTLISAQILVSAPAVAQPGDLRDLIGARGSSAEGELGRRGYGASGNVGAAQMWWSASRHACVSVLVDNGRVQSIQNASAGDCGRGGGGGNTAAAVVGGALVIGLAAALASHHRSTNDRHRQQAEHDGEYERGYNDGMYGAHYDNNDSEGYHEGYMAGEREASNRRAANRSYVRSGAPAAAVAACARRADEYQNVPAGSSVATSVFDYGQGNYELTMAAGHYRSRCSVDARGRVSSINPY